MARRFLIKFLRVAVASNLVTTAIIFAGMPRGEPEVLPPAADLSVPSAEEAALPTFRESLLEGMRRGAKATLVVHTAPPPSPEPEILSEPDEPTWSPPTWFPEDARDGLWAIDGMNGEAEHVGAPMRLYSKAAFVYDVDSGRVLLSHAGDERRPVASLTKLVSAMTTMSESPDLEREVCLDNSMRPSWPGAVTRLRYGACTTGWDLLGAALVRSDNGAALSLSEVSGLPLSTFIMRMNEVAQDLHMDLSTFSDPSGVWDENLSTARDMTRVTVAAALHPTISLVASAPYWDVEYDTGRTKRMLTTNKLIGDKDLEILAAKTGYTDTARHCFTTVVRTDDGRTLAMTTLGARRSRQRWSDVRTLLRWAEKQ
ncbi:MAG: D-alanyl-D-alanine endopeptidase (penicillin-binding protein 7) [Myxococcota bacterium]